MRFRNPPSPASSSSIFSDYLNCSRSNDSHEIRISSLCTQEKLRLHSEQISITVSTRYDEIRYLNHRNRFSIPNLKLYDYISNNLTEDFYNETRATRSRSTEKNLRKLTLRNEIHAMKIEELLGRNLREDEEASERAKCGDRKSL